MTPRELGAATLAALALATLGATLLDGEEPPRAGESVVGLTRLAVQRDGGRAYVVEVRTADGGRALRVVTEPGCVRRRSGAPVLACRRREPLPDGGLGVGRDFGDLNRFPASQAVGAGCEPVACSVVAGDDADEDEERVVGRVRDGGLLARLDGGAL